MVWRRLALVDAAGVPTLRGRLVSFFSQGDGLAIAAGLEDATYPIEEMVYDLANLEAGFRFAGDDNRWAGRLALACHQAYGLQTIPGYLEHGLPPKYGAGAELIVATVHKHPERAAILGERGARTGRRGPGDHRMAEPAPTGEPRAGAGLGTLAGPADGWRATSCRRPSRPRSPSCRRSSSTSNVVWTIASRCAGIDRPSQRRLSYRR